jgi:C4-dicarboxylate-specific signal transduction histidine kinase/ABC-type nitrate/sulfonate/bicarbonate transport system substrate-binding protein
MILRILFITILLIQGIYSKELERVSLQFQWLDQFQFAGYYMAKEKGFYKDANLDVKIKKYHLNLDVSKEVLAGKANFGVGHSSLIASSASEKIVLLSAIYQSSPLAIIALESSNIKKLKDFEHKTIMLTKAAIQTASIHAMVSSGDVDEATLLYKEHNFNLNELIEGKVDLYAGYISNEPFLLKEKGIKYKLFYPQEQGFDFYGDLLFTSQQELDIHPLRVKNFKEASLKGWRYAFNHIEESVDLIYKKYNPQHKSKKALMFEAQELKKLAYNKTTELGHISKEKVQRTYDIYKIMGLIKGSIDLDSLVYNNSILTSKEKQYLKEKKVIKICVPPNARPYSAIENGKYIGIGADILALTKKEFSVNYQLVKTNSWQESLQKGMNQECDLLPVASPSTSRKQFFKFTTPYHKEPLVITTKTNTNYIIDFNTVLDKTFTAVKGHAYIEILKEKYPSVKIDYVKNTQEGLKGVKDGKYFAHIDVLVAAAYGIKNIGNKLLQISGVFEKKVAAGFAVRKDDEMLFNIYEKASQNINPEEIQTLLNNWVRINYRNTIVEYSYVKEFIIFSLFLTSLFLIIYIVLKKKNEKLEFLQEEILEVNKYLELRISDAISDLERAQEVASVGSWIFDIHLQDLKCSNETYRIFAVDKKKHTNILELFIERIHPEDRELVISTYTDAITNQTDYSIEHRLLMDDGSIKHVIETCKTSYDKYKNPLVSYGTVQDITQRIEIQNELKKKDMMMFQQSRLAQMGEMLSMIAHQWRQPLSSISASASAVKTIVDLEKYDLSKEKEQKEFLDYLGEKLDKIALHVQNLSQIITDFSSFYKPHKSASLLHADDVMLKTYRLLEDSLSATKITVSFELLADTEIMMYENEFMQVILNIITNAKEQFVSNDIQDPEIYIRSYTKEGKIFIELEDNAGGIDENIIKEIFDPYFSTKLEKNGTGLGLYMSKIILRDYHQGDIEVRNGDFGAIFTVIINTLTPENKVNKEEKNEN